MAQLTIFVPDALAVAAREAGLDVSALAQDAIRHALGAHATGEWLATLSERPPIPVSHESVIAALDRARGEPTTRPDGTPT